MKKNIRELILEFQIDDPADSLTFTSKLARENGWSSTYARRVVTEYLKFIVLCSEAGHKVSPSDAVDQAWHLHMCYTQSYWEGLCRNTLGFPLHHGPTRGGAGERAKFYDWYSKTLVSYERVFGELPPEDIWLSPEEHFSRKNFRRINCQSYFIIPKKILGVSLAGIGAVSCLAGCASGSMVASAETELLFIFGFIALFILVAILSKNGKGGSGGGDSGGFFGGCGNDSGCGGGCGD